MNKIKENIIRTGLKQFKHFGIKNVSIDDICAELKISKKTFYQFFNTKETFIAEVIDSHHLQHIRKFEKSVKGKNAIEVFLHTIKEVKKSTHDHPNVFWNDLKKYYPRLYEQYEKLRSNAMEMGFKENIIQGIEEGYYRKELDVELLSFFHTVQMKQTFLIMLESNKKYSMKRIRDFFIDMMIHLIANEKGLEYLEENFNNVSKADKNLDPVF